MYFRQLLVAGSCLLAALSIGCSVTFPSVLLKQLASNTSTIHLDLDTASWIGSIHGLAGIPSIVMPVLMQWRGRKFAFISTCLISITGWLIAYTATSSAHILLSESIHGFGSHSTLAVGMISMSEMLSPRYRNVTMAIYMVMQTLGMMLVEIVGNFVHWRTTGLLMSMPIVIAALGAFLWPESPSWLACKGQFDKCTAAFTRLRGTNEDDRLELEEMIIAQKENLSRDKSKRRSQINIWNILKSRDFYLPAMHIFLLMQGLYWSGIMACLIYSAEIIQRTTNYTNSGHLGSAILNFTLFVSCIVSIILIKYFSPKKLLLVSSTCTTLSLFGVTAVNYFQTIDVISEESDICMYILFIYMAFISMSVPVVFSVGAELMPVKHRGLGGPLYVIYTCVEHASSLKLAPYLYIYINIWGTMLLYAVNTLVCGIIIWKFLPETKGKTLQQLEDYYAYGDFEKRRKSEMGNLLYELMPMES